MSNVVDERVVILRFDNQQFEKATRESMSTLERLKKSTNFKESEKALSNLGNSVKSFNVGGMVKGVETLGKRFSTLGVAGMSVINNLTNAGLGFVKNVVTAIPNQIKTGGWTRAANIEKAKFQIEGLGKVWDETSKGYKEGAQTIKQWVDYAVDGTAYGLDEAAVVASQFAASGMEASEDMGAALRAVSGVAAMTGSSYAEIGHIFTKTAGQGKAMGDQWLELSTRGLNGAVTVADYMNGVMDGSIKASDAMKQYIQSVTDGQKVTEEFIRDPKTSKAGVVTWELFYKAMDNAYGEYSKKANETYTGAFSNLKSAFNRLGEDFEKVKLDNLMNIFNALRPLVNNVRFALQPLIIAFNKLNSAMSSKIIDIAGNLALKLKPLADRGKELKATWDEEWLGIQKEHREQVKGYEDALNGVSKATEKTEKATKKSGKGIKKAVQEAGKVTTVTAKEAQAAWDIWNKGTYGNQPVREKNLAKVGLAYKNVQAYVNELIRCNFDMDKMNIKVAKSHKKAGKAAKENAKGTKEAAKEVKPMAKALETLGNILSGFKNLFSGIGERIKNIGEGFKKSLLGPVMKLTGSNILTKVRDFSKNFMESAKAFKNKAPLISGKQISGWNTFFNVLSRIWTVIRNVGAGLGGLLFTGLKNLFGLIGRGLSNLKEFLATNERLHTFGSNILKLFEKLGKFLVDFFEKVKEFFNGIKETEGFKQLADIMTKLWDSLKAFSGKTMDKINSNLSKLLNLDFKAPNMQNAINAFGKLSGKLAEFTNFVTAGGHPIKGFIDMFKNNQFFSSFGEKFSGAGNKLIDFFKKLKGLAPKGGKGGTTANALVQPLTLEANLKSKFEVFKGFLEDTDWNIVAIRITGLLKAIGKFRVAMNLSKLLKSMGGISDALKGFISSWAGVGTALKDKWRREFKIKMFRNFVIGIGVIVGSLFLLSKIPADELKRSMSAMVGIIGSLVAIMILIGKMQLNESAMAVFSNAVAKIGAGMILMSAAIKIISSMKNADILKGGAVIVGLVYMLTEASKTAGEFAGTGLVKMAASMILFSIAMKIFAKMSWGDILKGGVVIVALVGILSKITSNNGVLRQGERSAFQILKFAVAIDLIAVALMGLSALPIKKIWSSVGAISALLIEIAIISKTAGDKAGNISGIKGLTGVIVAISLSLSMLATMPIKKVWSSVGAIGSIMAEIAVITKIAGQGGMGIKGAVAIAIMIGTISAAFVVLGRMNLKGTLKNALAMSSVLTAVGVAIRILAGIPFGTILSTAVAAGLAVDAIVGLFAGLVTAFGAINKVSKGGFLNLLEEGGKILGALGDAIGSFIGGIAGGVIDRVGDSFVGFLTKLGTAIMLLGTGLKASKSAFKGFDKKNITLIKDIAEAMISITQANAMDSRNSMDGTSAMVAGAAKMQDLAKVAKAFIDATKGFDASQVKQAKKVASMLKDLTKSLPETFGGFSGLFDGFTSLNALETQLPALGRGMGNFIQNIAVLAPEDIEKANGVLKPWGKFLKTISKDMPKTFAGVGGFFSGFSDLSVLGEQLGPFGRGISNFIQNMSMLDLDDKQLKTVQNTTKIAGELIKEFSEGMPETRGGVQGFFTGFSDLGVLGDQLPIFARGLGNFIQNIAIVEKEDIEKATAFIPSISTLMTALSSAPTTWSGLKDVFTGGTDFNQLAEMFGPFGRGIGNFIQQLTVVEKEDLDKAADFMPSLNSLMTALNNAPIISTWAGGSSSVDWGSFEKGLAGLGRGIAGYARALTGVKFDGANQSITSLNKIASGVQDALSANLNNNAVTLEKTLPGFGRSLATFFGSLKDETGNADEIVSALQAISKAASNIKFDSFYKAGANVGIAFTNGMKSVDVTSSVGTMISSVTSALVNSQYKFRNCGNTLRDAFTNALKSNEKKFSDFGKSVTNKFCSGVGSSNRPREAGRQLGNKVKDGARGVSFYDLGRSLVSGFASGIRQASWIAESAARSVARASKNAAQEEIDAHSPARELVPVGTWFVQGFAKGIDKARLMAVKAARTMAESSISESKSTLSKLANILSANVDTQPVITPVWDDTNIRNGARRLSTLISNQNGSKLAATIDGNIQVGKAATQKANDAISNLTDKLSSMADPMNSRPINNNITVNGAENPEQYANRLVHALKVQLRTV